MERKMFYNASPDLFSKAQMLRNSMTVSEKTLWENLKENKLGVRFKHQHPIDIFIADFYCHALKLVIEIDGDYHQFQIEKDKARTEELQNIGIEVIRFTNEDVENNIEIVLQTIVEKIKLKQEKNATK